VKKEVIAGLVLGAVLITAIIAFWIIIKEPIGEATMKPYCYGPGCGSPTQIPKIIPTSTPSPSPSPWVVPWERTPTPTEETTPSQSPYPWEEPRIPWDETPYPIPTQSGTQYPSPSPSEETTPTPFDYTPQTNNFCDRAKKILESIFKPKKKSSYFRCSGSYDTDTGDYEVTLEFTFMP